MSEAAAEGRGGVALRARRRILIRLLVPRIHLVARLVLHVACALFERRPHLHQHRRTLAPLTLRFLERVCLQPVERRPVQPVVVFVPAEALHGPLHLSDSGSRVGNQTCPRRPPKHCCGTDQSCFKTIISVTEQKHKCRRPCQSVVEQAILFKNTGFHRRTEARRGAHAALTSFLPRCIGSAHLFICAHPSGCCGSIMTSNAPAFSVCGRV